MKQIVATIFIFALTSCASNNGIIFEEHKSKFQSEFTIGMSESDVRQTLKLHFENIAVSEYKCDAEYSFMDSNCLTYKKLIGSYKFGESGLVCSKPTALLTMEFDVNGILVKHNIERAETCL